MPRSPWLLLPALSLLGACGGADPQVVAAQVLAGDLAGASTRLVAEGKDPALAGLRDDARRWQVVAPERSALDRASRELLRTSIEARVHQGDLSDAAGQLAVAIAAWPQDPGLLQLAHDLGQAAEGAPPDAAVAAWQALAQILADDHVRARGWQERAEAVALGRDYGPERLAVTRAALRGVRRDAAVDLLQRLDREYVDAPDWGRLSAAGAARLGRLVATPGVQGAWPGVSDLSWPTPGAQEVQGAVADLDTCLAAARAAKLPEEVVIAEWVRGALAALDPWTRAVWPAEIASWQAGHAGVEVGVGLELQADDSGGVRVARPLPGTPAWVGGVHQGDVLLAVSDDAGRLELAGLPGDQRLERARKALVGAEGSAVTLELLRAGAPLRLELQRAPVVRETVQGWERDATNAWSPWLDRGAGLAYVRIEVFRAATPADLDALLAPAQDELRAVVLDLRGDPGGDVNAAVRVADRFVATGTLARISGRVLPDTGPDTDPETGEALAEWNDALPGGALESLPVVVLVDGETASAAEVVAGALQQLAQAVVVGSPTWGKGYAQALRVAPDGSYAVQLTNLVWTLPEGQRLAHVGLGQGGQGAEGQGAEGQGGIQPRIRLPAASPGEAFRTGWLRAERGALRVHADGSPMQPVGTPPRPDLPALAEDPAVLAGEMAARALLIQRAAAQSGAQP